MILAEINQAFANERVYWRTLVQALSGSRRAGYYFWKKKDVGLDLHSLHADPDVLKPDEREEYRQVFVLQDDTDTFNTVVTMKQRGSEYVIRFETKDVYSDESDWNEFVERHMTERAAKELALDLESDIQMWAKHLKPQMYRKGNVVHHDDLD